jgi:nitrogen fixation protein NifU and related proteins
MCPTMSPMYSAQMLDHFQNPRNIGEVEDPDVSVQLENPACGDVMRLAIKVAEGRVSEIRFWAKGCVPTMACGSAITELVLGKTISQAAALTREDLVAQVGGLPEASAHASQLAMDILARALRALRQSNP